jgi:hypothetical protein
MAEVDTSIDRRHQPALPDATIGVCDGIKYGELSWLAYSETDIYIFGYAAYRYHNVD